jgi:hypothetical protein
MSVSFLQLKLRLVPNASLVNSHLALAHLRVLRALLELSRPFLALRLAAIAMLERSVRLMAQRLAALACLEPTASPDLLVA